MRNNLHMDTPSPDFGHLAVMVRMSRERKGWTQAQLAIRADISVRSVSAVESGEPPEGGKPTKAMRRVADALGWQLSSLERVLSGELPVVAPNPEPTGGRYISRNIEDQKLGDLRDDEILAYLARRAAEKNPDSPHYRPDAE